MILNLLLTFFVANWQILTAEKNSKRVINGYQAHNGYFPYVGALIKYDSSGNEYLQCSATLLDSETILTTAHCFCEDEDNLNIDNPSIYSVIFGSVNLRDTKWMKESPLSQIYIHDSFLDYENNCKGNSTDPAVYFVFDLAVAKLLHPISYNRSIQPVQLSRTAYRPGKNVIVAGFGRFDRKTENLNLQLYWTTGNISKEFGNFNKICNDSCVSGATTDSGDSGGAIMDGKHPTIQLGLIVGGSVEYTMFHPSYKIFDWVYRNNQFSVQWNSSSKL